MPRHITTTRRPKASEHKLDVIVLAGVMGYRMKSYGPRCLMKLRKDETVLDRQLSVINTVYSHSNNLATIGFEADKVAKSYAGKLSLVEHQYCYQNNEGDEVRLAINNSTAKHILIVCGHMLFNQEALRVIDLNKSGVLLDNKQHLNESTIAVNHQEENVTSLMYGKEFKDKWSHIVYFTGKELELLRTIVQREQCHRHFLHEIINAVILAGGKMRAYQSPQTQLAAIESYTDYLAVQKKEFNYV
jgi:bifunctional N-acetylglucosamine-1-phosphate-uridyltransferase/glucosamine-1-phosphate-acetyltransferase GlmU-like protein